MALHFPADVFDTRRAAVVAAMAGAGLDGLLMFHPESHYWLTGYDTFGFCFFQCLYLGADGRLALLTRSADLRQARHTSVIADVRIWTDADGAKPAGQLRGMLESLSARGRLGTEADSHGLTHANGRAVEAALDGLVTLVDASRLVDHLRVRKSAAELAYVRQAGRLADAARQAGIDRIGAGAGEADILAAMQGAVLAGGGDYPANEFIIGSDRDALLCRSKTGRRVLSGRDQITLEFAGVWRRYHAALMLTAVVGEPSPRQRAMHAACAEALAACEAVLRPGNTAGAVFAAHARVLDGHGFTGHRLNACGYSLGARYAPSWMDPPMFYADNPWPLEAGMVVFLHMILMDSETGTAMCLGRTSIVTEGAPEVVCGADTRLVVR